MALKIESAVFETSVGMISQLGPSELPEVAFSGRSNVGKSSLINKLTNRKSLARVSSSPGKTATINFYHVDNDKNGVKFIDLPGYGYAKVSKTEKEAWGRLIEYYFAMERDMRLVIQLVDMRHPPTKDDYMMLDFLTDSGIPYVVALTKADKLRKNERSKREEAITNEFYRYDGVTLIPFSTETGEGVKELLEIIDDVSSADLFYDDEEEE